jgi:hypothetical protein
MYVRHGQTVREEGVGDSGEAQLRRDFRLRSGFESPDLDGIGVVSTPRVSIGPEQGLCEARLGYRDGSPQLGAPGPGLGLRSRVSLRPGPHPSRRREKTDGPRET